MAVACAVTTGAHNTACSYVYILGLYLYKYTWKNETSKHTLLRALCKTTDDRIVQVNFRTMPYRPCSPLAFFNHLFFLFFSFLSFIENHRIDSMRPICNLTYYCCETGVRASATRVEDRLAVGSSSPSSF